MTVHILKVCVGIDSVEQLIDAHKRRLSGVAPGRKDGALAHRTRNFPRRAGEILEGGSLYWVIRGAVLVRQPIASVERLDGGDANGGKHCAFVLQPVWIRTQPQPRRPHQGWRYLEPADVPADLRDGEKRGDALPPHVVAELRSLGLM